MTLPLPSTRQATALQAVTGASDDAWFLARGGASWSVFGVNTTGRVALPSTLSAIPAGTQLAEPASSGANLYTTAQVSRPTAAGRSVAQPQPALWVINPATGAVSTVPDFATYPRASSSERASFAASAVVSAGPRVIYDNPDSLLGVVVFTDGSRPPVTFDKANALTISPEGPSVLANPTPAKNPRANKPTGPGTPTPTTVPPSPPVVNQKVNCQDTAQTPRAPQIAQTVPSARSVLVRWTYPLLDEQDCEPDSWAITVQAIGAPQPSQPEQTESGQLQYQFAGLRPSVRYQVTVTAYINTQTTSSDSSSFTTLPSGADAPAAVTTSSDGRGNWVVQWKPCTAATCYVPAATWVVTGSACGGFVSNPPVVKVDGSQTSATISADQLSLLGDSLSFQVQGISAAGLTGGPTADHACTQSWRPPDPASISVAASGVAVGQTIAATVQVSAAGNSTNAFGSQATTFTYHVGPSTVGPTPATSVKIPGLAPGSSYTPSVTITPTGHPGAALTVTGSPFQQNLTWPVMTARAQGSTNADPNEGTVVATFSPVLPVALDATGTITCGSSAIGITKEQLSGGQIAVPMDLTTLGGFCTLSATLSEASGAEYALPDPQVTTTFNIGTAINTSPMAAVFPSGTTVNDVVVEITGAPAPDAGANWTVSASWPDAAQDGCTKSKSINSPGGPPTFPLTLDLGECADTFFAPGIPSGVQPISVAVAYKYLGQTVNTPLPGPGTGPTNTTTTTTTPTTTTTTTTPTTATTTPTTTATTAPPPPSTLPPCTTTTTSPTTTGRSRSTTTTRSTTTSSTTACTPASAAAQSAKVSGGVKANLAVDRTSANPTDPAGQTALELLGGAVLAVAAAAGAIRRKPSRAWPDPEATSTARPDREATSSARSRKTLQ